MSEVAADAAGLASTSVAVEIRAIPGHSRYAASCDGRIWSCCRGPWRQMSRTLDRKGQPKVTVDGKTYKVHTLVALTFLGPRPPKHDVDHKDGNKQNCAVPNLEYCTRSQNVIRALKAGRQPPPPAWVRRRRTKAARRRVAFVLRRKEQADELGIRQVANHPNYGVTADGQAWSFARKKTWRKLVHIPDARGLPKVKLGERLTKSVHTLVAQAFLGPRPPGAVIIHADGKRWNTAASNLRYVSKSADNLLAWAEGSQSAGWPTRRIRLRANGHARWGPNGSYPQSFGLPVADLSSHTESRANE